MELVLVKNKGQIKVYQGTLDYHEDDYYFFASVKNGEIVAMEVKRIDEETGEIFDVPEYTKGRIADILTEEYILEGV
jgi:hypothetical protein